MTVPDNIVRQIAEGCPVLLALLCTGLRSYYQPDVDGFSPGPVQFSPMEVSNVTELKPASGEDEEPEFSAAAISRLSVLAPPGCCQAL